ncbi:hypothetical protein NP493_574g00012, partial [Ridgeia piscesae]
RQCHHWHCLSQFVHLLQPDSVTTDLASVSLSTTCSQTVSPLALPQSVCPTPAARQCHHWQCLSQFVHLLQPDSVTTDLASVSLSTTCSQTVSPLTLPQSVCPPPAARQCHHWHCLSQFVHHLQPDSVTTGIASSLNMMVLLDLSNSLVLYSGMRKINKIHVGGLPSPSLSLSSSLQLHLKPVSPFGSPVRLSRGPVTSSRPPSALDARFDDEVQLLSPVPTEFNDSSQLLDVSLTDELSFQLGDSQGCISGLRDPVDYRFTLELRDGSMYRVSLPKLTTLPIIQLCMEALRQILPKDTVLQVLIHWYSTHNAPGSVNGQSEWIQFARCILGMMGYDMSKLHLTRQDWQYLLTSDHHQLTERSSGHLLGLTPRDLTPGSATQPEGSMDSTALLFKHIPRIFFALHLVYEVSCSP